MAWFSILPEHLSQLETWLARLFILLGLFTIGPWAVLIIYDIVLYVFRSVTYEIPFIGGRARGKRRPRAPSLSERPNGHRRRFSLVRPTSHGDDSSAIATGASRYASSDLSTAQTRSTEKEQ